MSEAEDHLLQQVRGGDPEGWRQFVDRFERRLTAFAFREVNDREVAKDLVQETFLAFLKSVHGFRGDGSLESFLFRILRRRIIDLYRSQGDQRVVTACEVHDMDGGGVLSRAASEDMSASWYVRQEEQHHQDRSLLNRAIRMLAIRLQDAERFRDLKIAEGLFFAGLRNGELARLMSVSENEVAVVKHRLIKRLSELIQGERNQSANAQEPKANTIETSDQAWRDELDLREIWENHRPSCPKRTTLGKYTLEILPPAWDEFVRFHVEILGCRFCAANLDEIRSPAVSPDEPDPSEQFFQSTIGFLKNRG